MFHRGNFCGAITQQLYRRIGAHTARVTRMNDEGRLVWYNSETRKLR